MFLCHTEATSYLHGTHNVQFTVALQQPSILELGSFSDQWIASGLAVQPGLIDLVNALTAGDIHEDVQVGQQGLHHVSHAVFTHDGKPPHPQAPDENKFGAESEGFEYVGSPPDARVVHDVYFIANGCDGMISDQ